MLKPKTKYAAVITDCGRTAKEGQEPQPFVTFELTDEAGGTHKKTWYGKMSSEATKEYAAKQLLKIGFSGNDFKDLDKGPIMFNGSLKLTVELEHGQTKQPDGTYKADPAKNLQIKWINVKGKPMEKYTGAAESQVALFAKVKAELGLNGKKPITTTATTTAKNTDW
jgi:hypothetical protein